MRTTFIAALVATSALVPLTAQAATVTTTLNYAANNVGLDGGSAIGFNAFTRADVGIANLRFGAEASGGNVDASASISFGTTFEESVELENAGNFSVGLALNSVNFEYDAFTGAEAGAFVDFKPFFGINPDEFRVIGDDYRLDTDAERAGFGSTGDQRANQRLAGVGPNISFGLGFRAEVNVQASQTTSFAVTDFQGRIVAEHESGAVRFADFSLETDPLNQLDLALAGDWTLGLENLALLNSFDSSSGIAAGYELGLAFGEVGGGCGDYSDDNDNENSFIPPRACVGDTGASGTTAQLSLFDPDAFEIDWGNKAVSRLGSVNVLAAPSVVPLPAGMPLLLAGFAGFAALRRFKDRKAA
ncbi:MAG: VPLPA-CTERM sorting domain-containing protein [Roseobacter sp.]